jgi:hypothetical protein
MRCASLAAARLGDGIPVVAVYGKVRPDLVTNVEAPKIRTQQKIVLSRSAAPSERVSHNSLGGVFVAIRQ